MGQAIPAFDFYMAPFVKMTFCEEIKNYCEALGVPMDKAVIESPTSYDEKSVEGLTGYARVYQLAINKTISRVHQSMESFVHNSNVIHSRGGNQVVFSSINYGTDTSAEGRLVIREILNTTYEGVGNGETAIFPIQIFKSKTGVSYLPTDPNYDLYMLACKVSAKRFYPNFINLDATFNQSPDWRPDDPKRYEHEVATMGCRTRVFENRFGPTTSIGRGNLSFTTINLPRLGIEALQKHDSSLTERVDEFFILLDNMLDKTARQLDARYQYQSQALVKQFPLLMSGMWNGSDKLSPEDTIESVLNQGTLGIGFIGLAECLVALTGHHHAEDAYSQSLGLKIVKHMKDKADEFSEKYQHNYSILATPAEGLSGRFTRIDKKKYGIISGVTDKEYYTNSNHVPVWFHCTASEKAAIECPYHEFTRGGHIFYVEQDGDPSDNPEAIMAVVDMLHKFNGGYASINYDANTCLDCGHKWVGKNRICPCCGSTHIDTLRRVTG